MRAFRLCALLFTTFACGCGSTETETPSTHASQSATVAPPRPQPPEWKVRGDALANKEDYQGAIAVYDTALKESPDNVEIFIARGEARQYSGDENGAYEDWQAVLKKAPHNARAWLGQGDCLIAFGKYSEAIESLNKAIECGLRDYRTYHTRSIARQMLGQAREALADSDEAIRLDPEYTGGRVDRGALLERLGEHEKAIADFTFHLQRKPNDANALAHRANSYVALGDSTKAFADLETAIRCSPEDAEHPLYLGMLCCDVRDYAAGVKWLTKAIELDLKARNFVVPTIEPKKLTEDDLAFGRVQLKQMIRDRRVLAEHLKEGDILWDWIVRQFAGESAGCRCRWNPAPPDDMHGQTTAPENGVGAIQVAQFEPAEPNKGMPCSFEVVLATAVFECFNHAAHVEFEAQWQQLLKGEIDAVAFARLSLEMEDLTATRTRQFFCSTYMDWASATQFADIDSRNWCFDDLWSANSIQRNFAIRQDVRWDHWLEGGIEGFAYGVLQRDGPAAAIKYLDSELTRADHSAIIRSRIHYFRANNFGEAGDEQAALDALNESIRLDPSFSNAYFSRSWLWKKTNDPAKELADLAKGLELAPNDAGAHYRRAEILVLNDDPAIRDGKAAIENAMRSCDLMKWEDIDSILMLAAAHAEAGNRDEAVKWQKKAAEMTPEANRGPVEAVIPIYEAGKTLRDAPQPPKADEQATGDGRPAK